MCYERNKNRVKQVLWVANFKPVKQPEMFIQLAKKFRNNKSVKFIMVGKSSLAYQPILDKITQSQTNFEYCGGISQKEVNKKIEQSDLFVNTSLSEGFPNTFIQAWLRRVPVLSMHIDPSQIIKKHQIGVIAPNLEQMVEVINSLLFDDKQFEKMGSQAEEYAKNNHSLKNIDKIKKLMELE